MNRASFVAPVLVLGLLFVCQPAPAATALPPVGSGPNVGCGPSPERVDVLRIEKGGTYENYLVDGNWDDSRNIVKITADNVVFKNSEVRFGKHNAIAVFGKNTVIENCKIHHMLKGSFFEQRDAHGITGAPHDLVIRNTEIHHVSGDSVQFDPGREPWGNVLIDNCTFWTGPLDADYADFKKGERPGENAVDTKQDESNPRSRLVIRNSLFHGWEKGQIDVMAVMNLKTNVEVIVENCVFRNNDYAFRLRGPGNGALVSVLNSAIYDTLIAFRLEDGLRNLTLTNIGFGGAIKERFVKRKADSKLFLFDLSDQATKIALGLPLVKLDGGLHRQLRADGPASQELRTAFQEKGIELAADATVSKTEQEGKQLSVLTSGKRSFTIVIDKQIEVYETPPALLVGLWKTGAPAPAKIREIFAANKLPLADDAKMNATKREQRWEIVDDQGTRSFSLQVHDLHETVIVNGMAGLSMKGLRQAPPYDEIMKRGPAILAEGTK